MKIEILDPIYCRVANKKDYPIVAAILAYQSPRWIEGRYAKEKIMQDRSFLDRRIGTFLTGFLQRVCKDLDRQGISYELSGFNSDASFREPDLPGITLRSDQIELLKGVSCLHRGYLKSATGTGKTLLAAAIHSMISGRTLMLCHTIDLLQQTADEFRKLGFDVVEIGAGNKKIETLSENAVVIALIQTWSKISDWKDFLFTFTTIIIDECHHVTSRNGTYAKILETSLAPIRIGLTATDQIDGAKSLILEGYLGPMIGEFTVDQGIKAGVLSKPEIHWINVPEDTSIFNLTKYRDIYNEAIINNRIRNRLIITEALTEISQGRSVLILVKEVEHAKNLLKMAEILDLPIDFVWSGTDKQDRLLLKEALESKDKKCIIASTVWKEGVNIRSLDCVINAAGGKSEISVLQNIGRGLRATETKNKVIIKDFIDIYKYLNYHTVMRLQVYVNNKWTMKGV